MFVMHALMHLRQQPRYMAQQRRGVWEDDRSQPAAHEVRVGVMGLGVLGIDAARKLRMMGFDVAGWSRSPKGYRRFPDILPARTALPPSSRALTSSWCSCR